MPAIGQYSVNQPAAGGHDLAGNLDKAHQEAFEFHPQDIATCRGFQCYQSIPGLQIPGQGRNDHISPIRDQTIRRHPQRIDPALELTDDIFLVAAVIGEENDLLQSLLSVIGDVEKISHIVEQPAFSLFDGEVFPNDDHPIGLVQWTGR